MWYTKSVMNTWRMFHTEGDGACDACVYPPTSCECAGLIHTHFSEELDAVEAHCDKCSVVERPEPVEVE
jgi:hypothetical protein